MRTASVPTGQIPLLAEHIGVDVAVAGDGDLSVREIVSDGANSPHLRAGQLQNGRQDRLALRAIIPPAKFPANREKYRETCVLSAWERRTPALQAAHFAAESAARG